MADYRYTIIYITATEFANKKKQQASAQSAEVEVQSKQIAIEKVEAEIALSEALPALEAARKALDNLNKSDLAEIRAFTTPPPAVQVIFYDLFIEFLIKKKNSTYIYFLTPFSRSYVNALLL